MTKIEIYHRDESGNRGDKYSEIGFTTKDQAELALRFMKSLAKGNILVPCSSETGKTEKAYELKDNFIFKLITK